MTVQPTDFVETLVNTSSPDQVVDRFLTHLLPLSTSGYVAFVQVTDEGWEELKRHFRPIREGRLVASVDLTATEQWYWTPSILSERSTQKEYAIAAGTLWVDIDNPPSASTTTSTSARISDQFDPFNLDSFSAHSIPAATAIVESSPGRYHLYWKLKEPLDRDNIEHYNRRLAVALTADMGGWDATQLLRLPIGVNAKTDPPTPVRLLHLDETTIGYDLSAFSELPEDTGLPIDQDDAGPPPSSYVDRSILLEKYTSQLSAQFVERLQTRAADRSRELWYFYHECYRNNIPKVDAFWLIYDSPNDKFAANRYHHEEELWRNLNGGYADAQRGNAPSGILEQIQSVRFSKEPITEKQTRIAQLVTEDMQKHGLLYWSETGQFWYLNDETGRLYEVDKTDPPFRKLILERYGINPAKDEYNPMYEHVVAKCQNTGPVKTHLMAYYDRSSGNLYVNRFDNYAYKLDGYSIERIVNGTDDVYFETTWQRPYRYKPDSVVDPTPQNGHKSLWDELVLHTANLREQRGVSSQDLRLILMTWVYSIFLDDLLDVRPILTLHGEAGSGKTSVMRAIGMVLEGDAYTPLSLPSREDYFDEAVRNRDFVVFDNVDSYARWLPDKLSLVATGFTTESRKLYTNNVIIRYPVRCATALTTREPKFMRDDVVDRLVPIRVDPWEVKKLQSEITFGIIDNRSLLMTELLTKLNQLVKELKASGNALPAFEHSFRMADFASLLQLVCELEGANFDPLMNMLVHAQALEAMEDDPMTVALRAFVEKNEGQTIAADALWLNLTSGMVGPEVQRMVPTPHGMAVRIGRLRKHLESEFEIDQPKAGHYVFSFRQ